MHTALLITLLGVGPGSWCSPEEWNDHPVSCINRTGLHLRYAHWQEALGTLARSMGLPMPDVRAGGLYDSKRDRLEVWHVGDGRYEVRIDPAFLRDAGTVTLRAVSAHEVCHIVNGDAGYGTWKSWTEEKRQERQRVAWACAFAIVGRSAIATYLEEVTEYSSEQRQELLRRMAFDADWWLAWRRSRHLAVP